MPGRRAKASKAAQASASSGASAKKRSKRKRGKKRVGGPAAVGGTISLPAAFSAKTAAPHEATLRLHAEELWVSNVGVDTAVHAVTFVPGASGLPQLDVEGGRWDLYKIVSCEVLYKPTVGTTANGTVTVAVDYDSVRVPATPAALAGIQPLLRGQVFQPSAVRVEPSRANKQIWLRTSNGLATDTAAFVAAFAASNAAVVGELWCRYLVDFTNPRVPAVAASIVQDSGGGASVRWATGSDSPVTVSASDGFVKTIVWQAGNYMLNYGPFAHEHPASEYAAAVQTWAASLSGVKVQTLFSQVQSLVVLLSAGVAAFQTASGEFSSLQLPVTPRLFTGYLAVASRLLAGDAIPALLRGPETQSLDERVKDLEFRLRQLALAPVDGF